MQATKRQVVEAYRAYSDGALSPDKTMRASLAYKISRNIIVLQSAYPPIEAEINVLREKYGWDDTQSGGGLSPTDFINYNNEYTLLTNVTTELDLIPIYLEELDFDITLEEMRLLQIMIAQEVDNE